MSMSFVDMWEVINALSPASVKTQRSKSVAPHMARRHFHFALEL
jgi:hypothetical protein